MAWMTSKPDLAQLFKTTVLCSLLILISGMSPVLAQSQTPNFDQLKERFDEGLVFASGFDHVYTDSYTGDVTRSNGKIWLDKVRYKLRSEGQTIVVNGETSQVYDPSRNRVIIDTYYPEEDDFAPSRMLSGIDSTYTVSEKKDGAQTRITLATDDDFAVFVRVEILIDERSRPLTINAWDISDNKIVTTFNDGIFLKPSSGLFELDYPINAEVVDMRY